MSEQNHARAHIAFALCMACASTPTQPEMPQRADLERTETASTQVAEPACIDVETYEGDEASFLRFLQAKVLAVGERLGRPLCISVVHGLRLTTGSERRMVGDISVLDTSSAQHTEVTVRVWARRSSGMVVHWEERSFSEKVAKEFALAALPGWLASQGDLRSFSRVEVVNGTWLTWLRHREDSTLCLQARGEDGGEEFRCWREPGAVNRVVPYEWWFHVDDPETFPEGYLAVFRETTGPMFSALRTHPTWSRAAARPQPLLAQARPSWWPSPQRIEPRGEVAIPRWRAISVVDVPDLGPLRWLKAKSLHMQGQAVLGQTDLGQAHQRQDTVVVARGGRHRLVCARQDRWTCSRMLDVEDGSNPFLENEYLDGFDIDGTSIALVRSARRTGGDVPGSESGADAYLEVWERGEQLVRRGSVHLGRASWQVERPLHRQVERVLHSVHVESDGCFRFEAASEHGETDADFLRNGPDAPLNIARAGDALVFADEVRPFADLSGHWRLETTGLVRVNECSAQPRTRLLPATIPLELEPRAAACLALINERIEELPPMPVVTGHACGATQLRHGVVMGRHRYSYTEGRLAESIHVFRVQPGDDSRYVERERGHWRGTARAGHDVESFHFRNGEEECTNTHSRRDTLDRFGRPTRIRTYSEPCEGDRRSSVERRSWHRGEGFDMETHDAEQHFYVPTYASSVAEVTCSARGGCSCVADGRDESGAVRMRLRSNDLHARLDYLYGCSSQAWPITSEALRELSMHTSFE